MPTWGMMFFSTASWKRGGGGRSTARNRKGDVVALISATRGFKALPYNDEGQVLASVDVKYWLLIFGRIGANDNVLGLRTDLSLKGGEYNTCTRRCCSLVSRSSAIPELTRVFLFAAAQIFVQIVKKPPEKFHWVPLGVQSEFSPTSSTNFLQEF